MVLDGTYPDLDSQNAKATGSPIKTETSRDPPRDAASAFLSHTLPTIVRTFEIRT